MANLRRSREGQSAAVQSSSVGVQEDGQVHTPSFRSQNDGYGDFCAVNDANGHDARRRSRRLEKQRASPTSVAERRAYDDSGRRPDDVDDAQHRRDVDRVDQWLQHGGSQPDAAPHTLRQRRRTRSSAGLSRSDAQRAALGVSPSGGSDLGAPVRPPPQKRRKDGPSGRDADAEPLAGATLALASRGDDTRRDVPFGNEPFAPHCRRAALIVKQYPDQPDVLSLQQVLASQVTRVALPKALALEDKGVVAGWRSFREYEAEVASLRGVCQRKLREAIMLSTLQVESLEHLADHEQVNILFFDPTWGKNGDEKNVGQRCYTYVVRRVYEEAAAIGVISADDARRLSEGQLVADIMPFAMDVSRGGTRLRPHAELLRLCSDEEELCDKLLDTHHKAVTAAIWTLARARRLMGKATCIVGWGGEGSEFAIGLGQKTDGDYLGSLYHPEQLTNAKQDVVKLLEAGRDVAILSHAGMTCCQHVFQSIACFRDVTLYREMTLFLEYYDKNSAAYRLLREARSKASAERWLDDEYRKKVIKGLKKYWKDLSPEKKEVRLEKQRAGGFGDGDLISDGVKKAHEKGAYDALYEQRRAEAEARHQALRDEGDAGAAKSKRRLAQNESSKASKKQKKEKGDALALKEAQLEERVTDKDAFREDKEAIKDIVAEKEREKDKKKRKAISMRETRARQKLAAKVLQRRVDLLESRVAELEEEVRAGAAA